MYKQSDLQMSAKYNFVNHKIYENAETHAEYKFLLIVLVFQFAKRSDLTQKPGCVLFISCKTQNGFINTNIENMFINDSDFDFIANLFIGNFTTCSYFKLLLLYTKFLTFSIIYLFVAFSIYFLGNYPYNFELQKCVHI